jgi:hypothetical protein
VTGGVTLVWLTLAAVLVLVGLLTALVVWYPEMKRIWLFLLPVAFFIAPRSLSTYLFDLFPAALVAAVSVAPAPPGPVRVQGARRRAAGVVVVGLVLAAVAAAVAGFATPPLQIGVRGIRTVQAGSSIDAVTVTVHNATDGTVDPHFMVSTGATHPEGFWSPAGRARVVLGPHGSTVVTLRPAAPVTAPLRGSHWLVLAYTQTPAALSTSPLQTWSLGPAG